ncbi:MAG TPA: flagellar basal body rod C-terminal domain-containing protein, partial [Jatrophihabitans sp.]|nr:flagellar basal body rod C-terminal domain-containing protein [Jatrophihabitans sp.]
LSTMRSWLDVLANNIANVNTVKPTSGAAFQASYLEVSDIPDDGTGTGGGVEVSDLLKSSPVGRLTYQPNNPLADAKGYVRLPDIDMGEQMGNLIMAQRGFQANAAVVDRARSVYEAAINIGKNH